MIFQLDFNPFSRRKVCLSHEPDGCGPTVVEFDRLVDRKLRHDVAIIEYTIPWDGMGI